MTKRIMIIAMMLIASIATMNAQEAINNQKILEWVADKDIAEDDIKAELGNPNNTLSIEWNMEFRKELNKAGASDELKQLIMQAASGKNLSQSDEDKIEKKHWGVYYINKEKNNELVEIPINCFQVEKKSFGKIISKAANVMTSVGVIQAYSGDISGLSNLIKGLQIANMANTLGDPKFDSEKLILEREQAQVRFYDSNPVFRFYFPEQTDNTDIDVWFREIIGSIKNPNDFHCVRLTPKKHKRTFPKGVKMSELVNITLTSNKENIIKFDYKQVDDNVYEITFPDGLEPGEYCFYYKDYANAKLSDHLIAFDFGID